MLDCKPLIKLCAKFNHIGSPITEKKENAILLKVLIDTKSIVDIKT